MATVLEIIIEALVTVKALAVGEAPDADMTTDALNKFNEVLESLSLQNLAIYASSDTLIPLIPGVAVYTLGPGGVGQRPISMNSLDTLWVTYEDSDFTVEVITQGLYDDLAVKSTTGIPAWAAYDNGFPNATLSLYPAPERNAILHISQRKAFDKALTLADTFDMPAGYRRMVRLMLAWELSSDYPGMGMEEMQKLQRDASSALSVVKRANNEPALLTSEAASFGFVTGGRCGNWRDGS